METMKHGSKCWTLATFIMLATVVHSIQVDLENQNGIQSAVFLSPEFALKPGSVANKFYYDIDFPRGHIAVKDFYAEVVDEFGKSVPLHETYLHHWVVVRYYRRKGVDVSNFNSNPGFQQSNFIVVGNSGICSGGLVQYFGLGSETRRTATRVQDPYGIEIGNPLDIPPGYEEGWLLNVHAIDTRGAEDRLGCTECRCDLYNVTQDEYGRPLQSDYIGGLKCCYDDTRCRVKKGFQGIKRSLFLKYNVTYVEWDKFIVPVQIYIFDVTDTWTNVNDSTPLGSGHHCQVEYTVESCTRTGGTIDTRSVSIPFPTGGDVIYGVAHQHTGGVGSALYGENGRVICSSTPIYGEGEEPGNEAGYIVGMTTCYPRPGTVKINKGEMLTLVSNYSGTQRHTGVMGLFYILVADSTPRPNAIMNSPIVEKVVIPNAVWMVPLLISAVIVAYKRSKRNEGYESILMS